jgi:hypothetical protein
MARFESPFTSARKSGHPRIKGLEDLGKIKVTDFEVIVHTGPNEGPPAPRK